ncbi:YoaK family protein [Acidisoma sp.]|uniref:YoaK family protein n=1 Tax=Acidisoma sp. TaxID=1872115 RepID=UPI003B001FE5
MPEDHADQPDEAAATSEHLFPYSLAATAGFADAFGYLKLHGLLTAHITGNLAFMAVGLAQGSPHILMKFLALPLFMAGVSLGTIIVTGLGRHSRLSLVWSLLMEAGLLLLCLFAGSVLPPCRFTDDLTGCCVGTLLIMSMALQNAIMRLPLKRLPSTTAMTTNITEATVQWTHWVIGFGRQLSPEDKRKLFGRARTFGTTVGFFGLGGVAGGLAAVRAGYLGLLAPTAVLALLATRAAFVHREPERAAEVTRGR